MAGKPKKTPKKPAPKSRASKTPEFPTLPPSLDIRNIGRPTKYDPSFCVDVIDFGAAGDSKTQIAVKLGVVRQTLENWMTEHPEFLDAMTRARELSLAWWETQGRLGIWGGKGFNGSAFAFQMTNRFKDDYKLRHEVSGDPENPIVTEVVRRIVDPAKTA
jgi:hypothetical protein